jgi:hypothetical protein
MLLALACSNHKVDQDSAVDDGKGMKDAGDKDPRDAESVPVTQPKDAGDSKTPVDAGGDDDDDDNDEPAGACADSGTTGCKNDAGTDAGTADAAIDHHAGAACTDDRDCDSHRCVRGGQPSSICSDGNNGEPCDMGSDCESGHCVTPVNSSKKKCGAYEPGAACPDGVADCNGTCQRQQASCSDAECAPDCGGACSSATFATWSPTDKHDSVSIANEDLTVQGLMSNIVVRATIGKSSGRWYWEVRADSASYMGATAIGVTTMSTPLDEGLDPGASYRSMGMLVAGAGDSDAACTYSSGELIGVALDLEDDVIYFSLDGVWQGGADPDAGTGGTPLGSLSGDIYPAASLNILDTLSVNFGQADFEHAPPHGFKAVTE